ncbi:MAG: hypothetical protein RQ754_03010 [Desulfuromonadales bacterium]|nr:hypothetical protein [Desulfuromonadales bacterium]
MELAIQNINIPQEYGVSDAKIAEIAEKYKDLQEIKDSASMGMAMAGRRECRELRIAVEKKRKDLKADALEYGRRVDGEAKRITASLEAIEKPLDTLIKAEEARKQAEKEERERLERERILAKERHLAALRLEIDGRFGRIRIAELHAMTAAEIGEAIAIVNDKTEPDWQELREDADAARAIYLQEAEALREKKLAAEAEAERQRIEQEKLAEQNRLEQEKLAEERRQLEAEMQQRREEQEAFERERRAFEEAKERQEQERLAKIRAEEEEQERQRLDALYKERAEQELKAKQEREEKERQAREEAERLAREREEMLRPDREKLKLLAGSLVALPFPTLTTAEGHKAMARIEKKLDALAEFIVMQAEKLAEEQVEPLEAATA